MILAYPTAVKALPGNQYGYLFKLIVKKIIHLKFIKSNEASP